jgi:hypothetical protein
MCKWNHHKNNIIRIIPFGLARAYRTMFKSKQMILWYDKLLLPSPIPSETSPRPVDLTPIPYPYIPNESVEQEADRFLTWVADSARRPQRTRRTSFSSTYDREESMPPTPGSALVTVSTADDTAVRPTNPHLPPAPHA